MEDWIERKNNKTLASGVVDQHVKWPLYSQRRWRHWLARR